MRLIRFGEPGLEKPGVVLQNGTRLDVSAFVRDYDEAFFSNQGIVELQAILSSAPKVDQSIRRGAADLQAQQDCMHRLEFP
jgi:hypothetical protein